MKFQIWGENWDKMCWGLKTCTSYIFSPAPLGDSQQSAYFGKDAGQLLVPHSKFPEHSESLSQSPSPMLHWLELEQQLHPKLWDPQPMIITHFSKLSCGSYKFGYGIIEARLIIVPVALNISVVENN